MGNLQLMRMRLKFFLLVLREKAKGCCFQRYYLPSTDTNSLRPDYIIDNFREINDVLLLITREVGRKMNPLKTPHCVRQWKKPGYLATLGLVT